MSTPLTDLGVTHPVLAAPMAGGPSAPALVTAAASLGSMGFLAAGYKTAAQLAEQIAQVRQEVSPFGVNLFVPNPVDISPADYHAYAERIRPLAERFGVDLPGEPVEDDDQFSAKVDLLLDDPVPVVSFTFGLVDHRVISGLQQQGTLVIQSVTSVVEAAAAAETGVDALAVQGFDAGGHSATLTPHRLPTALPTAVLVATIRATTTLPIIGAGGLSTPQAVRAVLDAGAQATMIGTALLRAQEAGTSSTHRDALADPARTETVLTRALTGRPARGIRNAFIDAFDVHAPEGYPALHHLTSALRKAAAAAGDADSLHLWAGTGFRHTKDQPAVTTLLELASEI